MYNAAGRRDLRNQNYSGQNLRGKDRFSGADLRGANFSGADLRKVDFNGAEIRGANFSRANLCEANFSNVSSDADPLFPEVDFTKAKIKGTDFTDAHLNHANFTGVQTGLTRFWSFALYIIHGLLCLISVFTTTISITFFVYFFRASSKKISFLGSILIGIAAFLIIVTLRTIFLNFPPLNSPYGSVTDLSVNLGIFAIIIVFLFAFVTALTNEEEDFSSSAMIGVLLLFILAITRNAMWFSGWEDELPERLRYFVHNLGSTKLPDNPNGTNGKWLAMVLSSMVGGVFGCWFSQSAITENTQFNWLWNLYIKMATHGGTLFNGSDLTDATFTSAILKGANFKNAVIARTRWRGVRSLEQARVGNSYLKYPKVRQIVVGRKLKHKNFNGLNLEGINLESADLSSASFVETNLKLSTFKGSNLKQANLQQAKLNGADLSNTCLTGACLQDCTTDEKTILSEIECEYIFLEELPDRMAGRRRFPPSPNNFRAGDFERVFRKDSSVLQLLIRNDFDRQALMVALRQLIQGNHYQLQGFEMIGDDALVRIQVPDNTDISIVENRFYQTYKAEAEQVDQERLQNPGLHEYDRQVSLMELFLRSFEMGANMSGSGNRIININGDGSNYNEDISGSYVQRDFIINMSQDLSQAEPQIQDWLVRLKKRGIEDDTAQKKVATDIATEAQKNQTVKEKLSQWGASLASATVSDVVKGVVKLACNSAGIPL